MQVGEFSKALAQYALTASFPDKEFRTPLVAILIMALLFQYHRHTAIKFRPDCDCSRIVSILLQIADGSLILIFGVIYFR
jgi:hypothetical protein